MKISSTTTVVAAALLSLAALYSNAQDKATLDLLVSKGVITKEEASKLSKGNVKIVAKDKNVKGIKITGRIQTQYENINVEGFGAAGTSHAASKNDFIMRRLFLGAEANLGSGWSGTVVADFGRSGDDKNYLENAYITKAIDWELLHGKLDIGYKKVNFGFEENTSASKLLSVERSLATRYWTEGNNGRRLGFGARHTGIFWNGKIDEIEGLEYGAAVTSPYNDNPTEIPSSADNTLAYWANVAYSGSIEEDISFKIGVNFGYSPDTTSTNVSGGSVWGLNPYVTANLYGFNIWGEFLISGIENGDITRTEDATPMGVNVGIEYRFDIGEWGKIGPTVRYSWLDTDGRGVSVSDGIRNANNAPGYSSFYAAQSVYAGVNWYIMDDSVKFQLGYEWAQFNGTPSNKSASNFAESNTVRAQMQILF